MTAEPPTINQYSNLPRGTVGRQRLQSLPLGEITQFNDWGQSDYQQRGYEDRFQTKQIGRYRYYAVFDGHYGANKMGPRHVSDYLANHFHEHLAAALAKINLDDYDAVADELEEIFLHVDEYLYQNGYQYGSTCTAILIDPLRGWIYQANLGDSRSLLFNDQQLLGVTSDHEPNRPDEYQRITAAGGSVQDDRVDGDLALSRAFGDFQYKNKSNSVYDGVEGKISALPEVTIWPWEQVDYIILTSDAPFEPKRDGWPHTNQDLVDMFWQHHDADQRLEEIAYRMVSQIYPESTDDTTILLVKVHS